MSRLHQLFLNIVIIKQEKHIAILKSPLHKKFSKITNEYIILALNRELTSDQYTNADEKVISQHRQQQALILKKTKKTFLSDFRFVIIYNMTIICCILIAFLSLLLYRKKTLSKPIIISIILLAILIAIGEYLIFYV